MPSLKEINGRIASVRSTLKITSAMKLVASAKLRKAQLAIGNMLPYEKQLRRILQDLVKGRSSALPSLFAADREPGRVAIVAISSNSSLCGAFNSSMTREVMRVVREYLAAGVRKEDITVYSIGRKVAEAMKRAGFPSPEDYSRLCGNPSYGGAEAIAVKLMEDYSQGRLDRVELVYNHFKSTSSQPCVREQFLPVTLSEGLRMEIGEGSARNPEDYIIEPDTAELIASLLPKVLKLKIFSALLDSNAAEHAARTVAMQTATDNGEKLLGELTLEYNKGRQQKITSEILDIVGGTL